jgi:replicative DNA helicase
MSEVTKLLDQLPPQNIAAERCVLGAMLRENSCIGGVVQILQADAFYSDAHQKIYKAILTLYEKGQPVDLVLLAERLVALKQIDDVGNCAYLNELYDGAPTAANIEHHARIVRDKAIIRNLIHASTEILRDSYGQSLSADQLLEFAERQIFGIAQTGAVSHSRKFEEILRDLKDHIDERIVASADTAVPTGYLDLDRKLLGGLANGQTYVVAARTSLGKTSLALGITYHVAVKVRLPVFFVSLEQTDEDLAKRLLYIHTGLGSHQVETKTPSENILTRLADGIADLSDIPLHTVDTRDHSIQNMLRIASNARRFKLREGIRLMVVDYIQLVEPDDRRNNRQEQVAGISRRLKLLANELQIPIVALAQLNRESERDKDKRPRLSHLRESDAVAHDADVVLLLSKSDVDDQPLAYASNRAVSTLRDESARREECCEVLVDVAKHRNGPTGIVKLVFRKACMRFENYCIGNNPFSKDG